MITKAITAIAFAAYMFAWLAIFVLPFKNQNPIRFLAFIPAAVFALGLPMLVADARWADARWQPDNYRAGMITWFILPFVLVAAELIWRRKKRKSEQRAPDYGSKTRRV